MRHASHLQNSGAKKAGRKEPQNKITTAQIEPGTNSYQKTLVNWGMFLIEADLHAQPPRQAALLMRGRSYSCYAVLAEFALYILHLDLVQLAALSISFRLAARKKAASLPRHFRAFLRLQVPGRQNG